MMHYGYSLLSDKVKYRAHCVFNKVFESTQPLTSSRLYQIQKHVKFILEPDSTYSSPQGYYSNLVKALGKSTAPAAAQWGEVAGGGM